jgi:hypothetical protein
VYQNYFVLPMAAIQSTSNTPSIIASVSVNNNNTSVQSFTSSSSLPRPSVMNAMTVNQSTSPIQKRTADMMANQSTPSLPRPSVAMTVNQSTPSLPRPSVAMTVNQSTPSLPRPSVMNAMTSSPIQKRTADMTTVSTQPQESKKRKIYVTDLITRNVLTKRQTIVDAIAKSIIDDIQTELLASLGVSYKNTYTDTAILRYLRQVTASDMSVNPTISVAQHIMPDIAQKLTDAGFHIVMNNKCMSVLFVKR